MRRRTLTRAMCMFIGLLAIPMSAAAQDGASVVVLEFQDVGAGADMAESTAAAVERGIEAHPDMYVKEQAEMTIQDLSVTAGCERPDRDCMKMLRDFIDGDRVVFGSVERSEDVYLFSMKMFDFAETRFITETTDQTVQGSAAKVKQVLPAVVENFLYGDVGTLVVEASGADSPEIIFNGQKIGLAPTTLENLPLGEHVITVKTADGEEQTKTIVLRYQEPVTLDFDFGGDVGTTAGTTTPSAGPSAVPGWVAIGIGVVGLGVGVFSTLQVDSANSDNEALGDFLNEDGTAFRDGDAVGEARDDGLDVEKIRKRGETYQTIQWIGYGVGAAGIITGGILVARAMMSGEKDSAATAQRFDLGVAPTRDGVAASIEFRF